MFELLPAIGIRLPDGAGVLRFGLDGAATREVLAGLGAVREDEAAAWAYSVRWGDVELSARAGTAPDSPLDSVVLRRHLRPHWYGPADVAVVLDDVDLFGYPAVEVLAALGPDRPSGLSFRPTRPGGYLPAVTLRAEPPSTEPDLAAYQDMWTTGRDRWQLEPTGSGYLVVMKGDPPMDLLICHETLAEQIIANMLAAGVEVVVTD
ncbi:MULTISPECIES: hypothetical protein [unclassified Kitasatospora]|uniref:hypothetical protein n=1 Tax=unclassified Kitasatospora TaxID=2633591 RepID=UPI0007094EEC|nr:MULTISPECIES: hypothetical protein [unclassified Kitasatospora]KQV21782.1 hypothetical protein ASC99_19020 [Kitasatospora sp. Root107]KRB75426.1 hypothetical protein ASE03_15735 [Kitasatospora sp. Root187]